MKRLIVSLVAVMVAASLAVAGCSSAAPTAPPTNTPPSTKVVAKEPSQAPATKPTSSPTKEPAAATAKKVSYPTKPITLIVPWPAGGSTDIAARLLASPLEKELGVSIQIVNRAGAGSQVGITEMATSKPDGYTLAYMNLPQAITIYLDPDRKAAFGRRDLQPVAMHGIEPGTIAVSADSPYKNIKDLVDAAKAKPNKIKASDSAILGLGHIQHLQLQQLTGAKFAFVHFDGGAPGMTALPGGHVDTFASNVGDCLPHVRGGKARVIGVADKEENQFLPGVTTMESQGYPVYAYVTFGMVAPKGTPKEIMDVLSRAIKKVTETDEHKKKMYEAGRTLRYLDTAQYDAFWNDYEARLRPLMDLAKKSG